MANPLTVNFLGRINNRMNKQIFIRFTFLNMSKNATHEKNINMSRFIAILFQKFIRNTVLFLPCFEISNLLKTCRNIN